MTLTINWNTLSIDGWEEKFSYVPRSNILQSYIYARAQCPLARQRARWGLIIIDGREAGLVQILEAGIFKNIFHAVMLDRGPLWFEGFGTAMHVKWFFDEWNRLFPNRFGRKRRILPETIYGPTAQKLLAQTGLREEDRAGYQTFWVDLTKDEESLRAAMKPKWRSALSKAERENLEVSFDATPATIAWALAIYAADKSLRAYGGPTPEFLKSYLPMVASSGNLVLARLMKGTMPVAFVICICHGRSATYFVGWNSDEGRAANAHQRLLWESVRVLRNRGIKELDMGGITDDAASTGLTSFKEGVGGDLVRYAGQYS